MAVLDSYESRRSPFSRNWFQRRTGRPTTTTTSTTAIVFLGWVPTLPVLAVMVVVLLLAVPAADGLAKPSSVQLMNNGYEGVVLAIRDDVPENNQLIIEIERMFTDASYYLYDATNQRAYISDVTVLLPLTWNTTIETVSPENYTYDAADVIVTPLDASLADMSSVPPPPYCKHFEGCGTQAAYIHFSSEFITRNITKEYYGNLGRLFVHEWGHFRWGLFNEYPDELTDKLFHSEFFYSPTTGEFHATRCSGDWDAMNVVYDSAKGRYRECVGNSSVGYEDNCISIPTPNQSKPLGSIMYGYTGIDQVTKFCDDGPDSASYHVREAPNKHNRLCDRKSSWEIMQGHPDFAKGNNLPRNISFDDLRPRIRFARVRPLRLVLVLDTSGSMETQDRITKQAAASKNFLMTTALDGMYIGIVHFSSAGNPLTNGLVQLSSEGLRRDLARRIPTVAIGGTCIGCGLEQALSLLEFDDSDPAGSMVILITDGEDSNVKNEKKTENMKATYAQLRIKIHAVAFSSAASAVVPGLSSDTGGKFFLQTDNIGSTGMHDAFHTTVDGHGLQEDQSIQLFVESFNVTEDPVHEVEIDSTIGYRTAFQFVHYTSTFNISVLDINITSPSGFVYSDMSTEYREEKEFNFVIVEITGIAEEGTWRFSMGKNKLFPDELGDEVLVSVSSRAPPGGEGAITATSVMSSTVTNLTQGDRMVIYSEVRRRSYPILNCDVIASFERPGQEPVQLELYDNGAGADITPGDGIYSRYFTNYSVEGFYGVQISISSNGITTIQKPGEDELPHSRAQPYIDPRALLKGNLSKYEEDLLRLPGAPIPFFNKTTAPRFIRRTSGGSNRVLNVPPGDFLPPIKIRDLRVDESSLSSNGSTGSATIRFTAPGDDLDYGTATSYVIRSSTNISDLENAQTPSTALEEYHLTDDLGKPKPYGEIEEFVLDVAVPENSSVTTIYVTVAAIDDNSNEGEPSNVGHATFRKFIPEVTPTLSPITVTGAPHPATGSGSTGRPDKCVNSDEVLCDDSDDTDFRWIAYFLGIGICLFLVVSLIAYTMARCSSFVRGGGGKRNHQTDDEPGRNQRRGDQCRVIEINELDSFEDDHEDETGLRTRSDSSGSGSTNGIVREPFISSQILDCLMSSASGGESSGGDSRSLTTTSSDSGTSNYFWGFDNYAFGAYLSGEGTIPHRSYLPRRKVRKYDPSFDKDNIHGQYF